MFKIGLLILGVQLFYTSCQKEDDSQYINTADSQQLNTVTRLSPNEFMQNPIFRDFNDQQLLKNSHQNATAKSSTPANSYEFLDTPVLVAKQENKESYSASVKKVGEQDSPYDTKLVIQTINGKVNNLLIKTSKDGSHLIISDLDTGKQYIEYRDGLDLSKIQEKGVGVDYCSSYSYKILEAAPCGCGGGVISTITVTRCVIVNDPPITPGGPTDPGTPSGPSSPTFGRGGNSPGDPIKKPNKDPEQIYIYEGEEHCFPNGGGCTPPLYWTHVLAKVSPSSRRLIEILNYISLNYNGLTNTQIQWINNPKNSSQVDELLFFLTENNRSEEAKIYVRGQVELHTLFSNNKIKLKPKNGKINNRDDQKYTHFGTDGVYSFYIMEDGSTVLNSPTQLTLNSDGQLVSKFTPETSNDHYWYIKPEGRDVWSNYLIKTNNTNLAHELEITAKLTLTELGKALGSYVLPVEDVKVLITGTDFDGNTVSRYQTAGFLLLTVIPGSKAVKIVGKASDALSAIVKLGSNDFVVDTAKAGLKIVTDSNVIKFLSQTGDEIARVLDGIMTFKYSGFGGEIITNPNKTTTVIGKWKNGTQEIIESGLSKSGKNKGGINALSETPDPNWNDQQIWDNINEPWLRDAASRNDIIRAVSNPNDPKNILNRNGDLSFFAREHQLLTKPTSQGGLGYIYNASTFTYTK